MPQDDFSAARVAAVITSLWLAGASAAEGRPSPAAAGPRIARGLNDGWRCIRKDVAGASAESFDDSAWRVVQVPHTWNAEDGADGGNDYYRGPAWYRLRLPVGRELAGRSLFLRFGAASTVADVYVNGHHVGRHAGGFSAFCFDVTPHVRPGDEDNLVAVRVTNAFDEHVTPISGDFTIYGGLYREVQLLALNPLSISPLDDASPGVYLRATFVSDESATIEATVKLRNAAGADANATVACTVTDADGKSVAGGGAEQRVAANSKADALVRITLPNPRRWDGRRDPYLYHVTIEVRDGEHLVDRIVQPLGVRTFRVDPERGPVLNGKSYPLHGVNYHQGNLPRGWADSREEKERDFRLIADLGCTGVRLAHYQHDSYEHTICDRVGLVVWAELGLVNKLTDSPEFFENARRQLRELIKQNYNHPSIVFWSLYNEPWIDKERGEHEWRLIDELNDLAHQLDPSRLTTGAVVAGPEPRLNWIMDVTAFNRYWGWYGGDAEDWPEKLDALRRDAGGRSFGIAEYGAGASVHHHELEPQRPQHNGHWHPEQWQAHVHETVWPALEERPWIWCKFIWVMFDFGSDGRDEGDRAGVNDKGLVTGDRKVLKDAYFYYKANWSDEPFVHITSKRFAVRPPARAAIKIYSNCPSVELFVNGVSLGAMKSSDRLFVWPDVRFDEGEASVKAVGLTRDGERVEDECSWTISRRATTGYSSTRPVEPAE